MSPTRGNPGTVLVDTSAAVPLVMAAHEHHRAVWEALAGRRLGLAGHAAFETFSVLTRLPAPSRRPPAVVERILATNFPESRFLGPGQAAELLAVLPRLGISGGSVYDALVGSVALEHQTRLYTRDRRALKTYRALGVDVELIRS